MNDKAGELQFGTAHLTGGLRGLFQDYLISVIEGKAAHPIDHNRLVSAVAMAGYAYPDLINRQTCDELISTGNLLSAEQFQWARKHWRDFSTDAPPMDMQRFMQQVSGNEDLRGEPRNTIQGYR